MSQPLANRRRLLARALGSEHTHAELAAHAGKNRTLFYQRIPSRRGWYEIEEFAKRAGSRMKLLRLALLLLAVVGAAGQRIGAEV